jgi:hypothetical protein
MSVRTKVFESKAGKINQIKIECIDKPIRFELVSGTFNYEILVGSAVLSGPTAASSTVLVPPSGAWGSEIRITCVTDGTLIVVHEG